MHVVVGGVFIHEVLFSFRDCAVRINLRADFCAT